MKPMPPRPFEPLLILFGLGGALCLPVSMQSLVTNPVFGDGPATEIAADVPPPTLTQAGAEPLARNEPRAVPEADKDRKEVRLFGNLQRIALAMLQYESTKGTFPSAAICDRDGKPLLSWRVAILPYLDLEQPELYNQFHLDEPWDSEHNKRLLEKMPQIFTSPGQDGGKPGMTRYVVPTGKETVFPTPNKAMQFNFTDGAAKTIIVVEAEPGKAVPWTKPDDLAIDPKKPHAGLKDSRPGGFFAAFVDTHVQLIPADVAADVLAALFTPAGGEPNHTVE
jgi:hypothetical protein